MLSTNLLALLGINFLMSPHFETETSCGVGGTEWDGMIFINFALLAVINIIIGIINFFFNILHLFPDLIMQI